MKYTYIRTLITYLLAIVSLAVCFTKTTLAAGFADGYFKSDGAHLKSAGSNSTERQKCLEMTDAHLASKPKNIKKLGFIAFGKNASLKVEVSEDAKDETIVISGSGYRPFETVNLSVAATAIDMFKIASWFAFADQDGKIVSGWTGYSQTLRTSGVVISGNSIESGVTIDIKVSALNNQFSPEEMPSGELWIGEHANPPRAAPFDFTTINLTPVAFSLVDNSGMADPHQTFSVSSTVRQTYTVTESDSSPYQLADIVCTYVTNNFGPAPIFTRTGATISIQTNYPNFVNCTFINTEIVTAANVSVSGRVLTAKVRGISNVRISVTDESGNTRTALSNPFGYYRFDELPAGQTYIFQTQSKRYQFTNPTQVLSVNGELTEVNFTASP